MVKPVIINACSLISRSPIYPIEYHISKIFSVPGFSLLTRKICGGFDVIRIQIAIRCKKTGPRKVITFIYGGRVIT
jgi:hypothetical protein